MASLQTSDASTATLEPGDPAPWRWDHNTTHNVRYLLPILLFARFVPKRVNHLLAYLLCTILSRTMVKTRRVVRRNIERMAGVALTAAEIDRTVVRTFRNYGRYLVDFWDLTFLPPARIRQLVHHGGGAGPFEALRAQGQGGILVTPHLGHWELGGVLLAGEGYPVSVAGLEIQDAWTSKVRETVRERMGLRRIFMRGDARSALASLPLIGALRNNEFVAMLMDRDNASRALAVDFGRGRMRVPTGAAVLAQVTGAPMLPVYVIWDGKGYVARSAAPVDPAAFRHLSREAAIEAMTRAMAAAFETIITEHLDQWFNFYPDWVEDPSPDAGGAP